MKNIWITCLTCNPDMQFKWAHLKYNRTCLIRILKRHRSSMRASGSLMQCKCDAGSSYRSFLHHYCTALCSHLSERTLNMKLLMVGWDSFNCISYLHLPSLPKMKPLKILLYKPTSGLMLNACACNDNSIV